MKRRYLLEAIADAQGEYGAMLTDRRYRRRDVIRCVRAGLVKSVGRVMVLNEDGDPAREPPGYREGFVLTEAGRRAI